MSYNFLKEKEAMEKALKEIKYDLSEIKIMIIGSGNLALEINNNLKNKCNEIYFATTEVKSNYEITKDLKTISLSNIREEICKMDIVFITENIFKIDKNILILMSNETVIVNLTKNDNVDLESAKKLKIKVIKIK